MLMTKSEKEKARKKRVFENYQKALKLRGQIDFFFKLQGYIPQEIKSNEYTAIYTIDFKKIYSFKVNTKKGTCKVWLPPDRELIKFLASRNIHYTIVKDVYFSLRAIIDNMNDFKAIYMSYKDYIKRCPR